MSTICTVCEGTGFINQEQIEDDSVVDAGYEAILNWIATHENHDVSVCHCCGDGEDWHGDAGWHYGTYDPPGPDGPYAYNGGLCECH